MATIVIERSSEHGHCRDCGGYTNVSVDLVDASVSGKKTLVASFWKDDHLDSSHADDFGDTAGIVLRSAQPFGITGRVEAEMLTLTDPAGTTRTFNVTFLRGLGPECNDPVPAVVHVLRNFGHTVQMVEK